MLLDSAETSLAYTSSPTQMLPSKSPIGIGKLQSRVSLDGVAGRGRGVVVVAVLVSSDDCGKHHRPGA